MANQKESRRFYGAITVSERGQIVIPAEARRDFNIAVGDKLLVFGDVEKGLWIVQASMLIENMPGLLAIIETEGLASKEENK